MDDCYLGSESVNCGLGWRTGRAFQSDSNIIAIEAIQTLAVFDWFIFPNIYVDLRCRIYHSRHVNDNSQMNILVEAGESSFNQNSTISLQR